MIVRNGAFYQVASSQRKQGSRINNSFRRKVVIITLLRNESLPWVPAFARMTPVGGAR